MSFGLEFFFETFNVRNCKPECREIDSWWSHWEIFRWINPSGRTMAVGSTHRLREMSTRNIWWGLKAACV